jgi:iron(III) transport system substrate-binding protein
MRTTFRSWRRPALVAIATLAASAAAVAGGASAAPSALAQPHTYAAKPSAATPKPYTQAQWARVIAAAKREGSLTLYSSQDPRGLQALADKFKAKYGISVTFNRQIDSVLAQQVTAEQGTGNVKADLWVIASKPFVLGGLKNGWATDARGPDLFDKRYDRTKYAKPGKAFAVGAAVQGIGWNTQQVRGTLSDYPDLLNPALQGRIGVVAPSGPSLVDVYLMLEEHYGKDYVRKLAAMNPKIYASTIPMQQALASGEIAASALVGAQLLDLKAQGAPVNFVLPRKGAWNAPWFAMVLKRAPHPNAAQLMASYMVTPEGQAAVNRGYGAVLKNVSGTFYVPLRQQKLSNLTPQKVQAYQAYWDSLFRK